MASIIHEVLGTVVQTNESYIARYPAQYIWAPDPAVRITRHVRMEKVHKDVLLRFRMTITIGDEVHFPVAEVLETPEYWIFLGPTIYCHRYLHLTQCGLIDDGDYLIQQIPCSLYVLNGDHFIPRIEMRRDVLSIRISD